MDVLALRAQYTERKGIFYSVKKMRTDFSRERRNTELDTKSRTPRAYRTVSLHQGLSYIEE